MWALCGCFCESAYICVVFGKVCTQDMCYDEIKLCAQNLLTVLGLIMNTTGGVEGGGDAKKEILHLSTCNFCVL
jgi:hypothetical protein